MLKVLLLCQFWNDDVTKLMNSKPRRELSPWIPEMISLFEGKDDVELHVLAPNYAFNQDKSYCQDGVHYYFIKYAPRVLSKFLIPLVKILLKHDQPSKIAERIVNMISSYRFTKNNFIKYIHQISPDVIHLSGSENPDYCSCVPELIEEYPVILLPQGYAYLLETPKNIFERRNQYLRVYYENKINSNINYMFEFSISKGFINFDNKPMTFPITPITRDPKINAQTVDKQYDIVFWSRVERNKGIEDLIESLSLLSHKGINIKALIVGNYDHKYGLFLRKICQEKDITDQITFTGYVHNKDDMFKMVAKAKILVIPSYSDGFNNSIREAMLMKLPVIANKVGGIPIANLWKECITLSEKNNIADLVENILLVLNDDVRTNRLVENAYSVMLAYYSNEVYYNLLLKGYDAAYLDFSGKKGKQENR